MAARFLGRFVTRLVTTSLVATFLVFLAVELSISGGYRAVLFPMGANAANPRDQAIVEAYHLDDPLVIRHLHWVADALQGDLGRSTKAGALVTDYIGHRFTISLELALIGMVLAVAVGLPLGLVSASWDSTPVGRLLTSFLSTMQALPVFVTATLLIWLFAVKLGWSRAAGWTRLSESVGGNLGGVLLPAVAVAMAEAGIIARVVRADVIAVLKNDYIAAAMGKGMSRRYILVRHALRPGSIGLLTVLSLNISSMIAGAFIVEIIFGIGGLGQAVVEASITRDLNLLLGLTLYTVAIYVVLSTLVDVVLFWVDPRISRE